MELGLTIPLQKHLNIKHLPYGEPLDRHFCWDLHVIALHGRSCLLAVHCTSRYAFTMFDLSFADWRDLPGTFLRGLRESLHAAGIEEMQIDDYLLRAAPPTCTKTHGRREVAFLNRAWDDIVALDYTVDQSEQCQPLLDTAVNALSRRCAGYEGLGCSIQRLDLKPLESE